MSKSKKSSQKKVIKNQAEEPIKKKTVQVSKKKTVQESKPVRTSSRRSTATAELPLLFGKQNYMLMLLGIGLITIGLLLMMGGHMPSRDVWDESLIYSTRRTLIAPFFILCGLIVEFFAIFRK